MSSLEKLRELYDEMSKHSHYQVLPPRLQEMTGNRELKTLSRWERERFQYITSKVPVRGKSILDIGGNSGYFTFEALEAGASRAVYYEGNKNHSEFVRLAAEVLGFSEQLTVQNEYYTFFDEVHDHVDIGFLLNVLHHLGDDYGDARLGVEAAKLGMVSQLNSMVDKVDYLALQIGFCWKGDRRSLLFSGGTKRELIDFVCDAVAGTWEILDIGIPERSDEAVTYRPPSDNNMRRYDAIGEFLNRPIFILKSLLLN